MPFCGHCSTAVLWCANLGSRLGCHGFHLPFGDIPVCFLGWLCPGACLPCCRVTACAAHAPLQVSVLILLARFVCWVPVQVSCCTMAHGCTWACWLWCLRSSLAAVAQGLLWVLLPRRTLGHSLAWASISLALADRFGSDC